MFLKETKRKLKRRQKQRSKNRDVAQLDKYKHIFEYERSEYLNDFSGKAITVCNYSKKNMYSCLDDFNCLVTDFKHMITDQPKSKLIKVFRNQIPLYFKAKIYGEYVMELISNIESSDRTMNILFDNHEEFKKFVIMMMILFKKKFLGYLDFEDTYRDFAYLVENGGDINYINYACPCTITYLGGCYDPLSITKFKLKIDDTELKFNLLDAMPTLDEYNFDDNSFSFVESHITWGKNTNGKLKFGVLPNYKLDVIKQNLIDKHLTLDPTKIKPKYLKTRDIINNVQHILDGYKIEEPFPMNINLMFKFDLLPFQLIMQGLLLVDLITIVYQFLEITDSMICCACKQTKPNTNPLLFLKCKCSHDICHLTCLQSIAAEHTPTNDKIRCDICFEGLF